MTFHSFKRRQVLAAGALMAALPPAAQAVHGTVRIVTSNFPPLSIEHGGEQPGALLEIVEELCRRLRVTPELDFLPWKRAIFVTGTSARTAIFPLTRQADREAQFRWLAQLYEENYIFLAPKEGTFDVRRPADMKNRRIAMIRGGGQITLLKQLGYVRVVEAATVDEVHRFLLEGMADAAIGERAIVNSSLKRRKSEHQFVMSLPVHKTAAWLAGSLDFTESEAAMFARAMDGIVADGTRLKILRKYALA